MINFKPRKQEDKDICLFWAHRTRSIPSRASSGSTACLVQTASFPIHTPCSLAPISAPQSQAGLLSTTAWVCSAWGMEMYVHYMEKRVTCKSSMDWPQLQIFAQQPHIWRRKYETYIEIYFKYQWNIMKKWVHLHCRSGSVWGCRVIHHLLHLISRPVRVLTKYHIIFFWTRRQRYKTVTWPRRFSHPISNQCIRINAMDHIQTTITCLCTMERIAVWKKDWKYDMRRLGYLVKKS